LDDASALLELRAPPGASIATLIKETPMTEQLMVRHETQIAAPPATVFVFLTDPCKGPSVEFAGHCSLCRPLVPRTKIEHLCQFCVTWHTPSRSVPVEMAETIDQAKREFMPILKGFLERTAGAARQD
jgi:hypothetical protein